LKTVAGLVRLSGSLRWLTYVAAACAVAGSVVTVIEAALAARMLDSTIAGSLPQLLRAAVLAAAAHVGSMVLSAGQGLSQGTFAQQTLARIRRQAAERLPRATAAAMSGEHSGQVLSRLTNDLGLAEDLLAQTVLRLVSGLLTAVLAIGYMFWRNWLLAIVAIFVTPAIFIVAERLSGPMAALSREAQAALADVNVVIEESLMGAAVVRAFGLARSLKERFDAHDRVWLDRTQRRNVRSAALSAVGFGTGFAPFLMVFGLGGYLVLRQAMTLGAVFSFIQLLNYVSFPIQQMPQLIGQVSSDASAVRRVLEVLVMPVERDSGEDFEFTPDAPAVSFEDVTFTYPGSSQPALSGLSFAVRPGERAAFAGSSGSGKSTVFRLVLGDYEPDRGVVRVGGHDVKDWSLAALRSRLAVVSQDTYLFPCSLGENISMGRPSATAEELVAVARTAQANGFVNEIPERYGAPAGELGGRLSGGERQRLSLARALVRRSDVMLLDEATSALDYRLENSVMSGIAESFRGTTLVIAHRLSTVIDADRIFVLESGRLVEQGTHADLMARRERYYELYSSQAREGGEER
jgi:ABC-type multidrug transport system fused ATPase/permease subunit